MVTTEANVRAVLQISSVDVLSDATINLAITDAKNNVPVSDEQAERYLAAYYVAKSLSWSSIKSTDGTTFEKPDPKVFWQLYTERLRVLGRGKMKKVNWQIHDSEDNS